MQRTLKNIDTTSEGTRCTNIEKSKYLTLSVGIGNVRQDKLLHKGFGSLRAYKIRLK
jgi:hypothetical protein